LDWFQGQRYFLLWGIPGDAAMLAYRKEVKVMKLIEWLRRSFIRIVDCIEAAWFKLLDQGPEMAEKAMATIGRFFTSPLSETEYALLKRVSGIMGTAVALYLTLLAGIKTTMIVLGLAIVLGLVLYKINGAPLGQAH
jgi:hypothetical protein